MRLVWLFVALVACGGPPRDVDSVLAAHRAHDRTIAASASRSPRPWRVGQWTLHKLTVNGELGYVKHAIVEEDACGLWLESALQTRRRRLISKACFDRMPDAALDPSLELERLQAAMMRVGKRTVVVDFRNGQNPRTKQQWMLELQSHSTLAWQSPPSTDVSTVVVSAGRFEGTARVVSRIWIEQSMHTVDLWVHADVPIGGAIKTVSSTGTQTELLDYGHAGAKSELPSFDQALSDAPFY